MSRRESVRDGGDDCSVLDIDCGGERLVGILHEGAVDARRALVVVVGGGQYRVGAHRQFVALARALSARGVPVLRFDVRGMGDSEGEARHFLDLGDDLRAAIDAVMSHLALDGVVLWGLCDGASASILYAPGDSRVRGVVLVNPWISTDKGVARAYLRHHYTARLVDRDFWRRLRQGRVDVLDSLRSVTGTAVRLLFRGAERGEGAEPNLPDTVFGALGEYGGHVLAVVSDDDMTAREFGDELARRTRSGRLALAPTFTLERMVADHTFSAPAAQALLSATTADWLERLPREG